jgi:very-short-patch-repair endonuclease
MNNYKKGMNGKFVPFASWSERTCENCKKVFKIKTSSLKYGRGRCCSRKCVDENKKRTQIGENNGMFGRTTSQTQKINSQAALRKCRKSPTFIENIRIKREEYFKLHGYHYGQSPDARRKRKETYSKMSPEKKKELRKKSEETCLKFYGKTSLQIRQEALNQCKITSIEKKIHGLLEKYGVKFIPKYSIPIENSYREYDFCIPDKKLLIEADGDFWHANPLIWKDKPMLDVQITNIKNDEYKNKLAKENGFSVVRFWESDINGCEFEGTLINKLKQYEVL